MNSENFPSPDRRPDSPGDTPPEEQRPLLNLGTSRPTPAPEDGAAAAIDRQRDSNPFPSVNSPAESPGASGYPKPGSIDPRLSQFEYPQNPSPLGQPPRDRPGEQPDPNDLELDLPAPFTSPPTNDPSPEPEEDVWGDAVPTTPPTRSGGDRSEPLGEFSYTDNALDFPLEAAAFSAIQGNNSPKDPDPTPPSPSPSPDAAVTPGTEPPEAHQDATSPKPDSTSLGSAPELQTLQAQKAQLLGELADLEEQIAILQDELLEAKHALSTMIREGCRELKERRQALKLSIEQLEQRQERIQTEMRQNFAGASQDLAVRVQSFKTFLVGSLQDLAVAADDLKLVPEATPAPAPAAPTPATPSPGSPSAARIPRFAEQSFTEESEEIRQLLDQYRTKPDYYGPPWQLRRTFEPIHGDRVSSWFFQQGGRGAVRSLGGRTQNILVASAVISILNYFYGEQLSALILANSPERLGEWRRGLQDCLGIARSDFGPNRGIALFEDPLPLAQRADRILRTGNLPLILIDESESTIDLSVLQFPLWLAFAQDPSDRRTQEFF